ncbi:MAG TPA: monovalent cation/H+ antiporter subunit D family protein [Candidatus Hydrogenedentes bacterium]|nr:monovalent cation/H+ antiporter subunit D family protein [Candidatus Hydrogenedentota bacterium]
MTTASAVIPLIVAVPLAGAFIIALLNQKIPRLPDLLGVLATCVGLLLSLWSIYLVQVQPTSVYSVGNWPPPLGIAMVMDGLSAFMLVTVNAIAFAVALYSVDYMERFTAKWQFHSLFLLMLAGMNNVIITGDLFNLFVFLEIAAVASYALVAFGTERHALEAAFKYAVMGTIGSTFILLAIVLLYANTSTLNMADIGRALAQSPAPHLTLFVSGLFIAGFGLKAAVVPFHAWLPDAHPSAPAPISAMLSGVLIKALGVYALCRVLFNVLGLTSQISSILMFLGALSMVIGVFLAIGQWDLKRLLAYHSISQIGYVLLGIGLGTPLGIVGGLFHLFNHSVFKSLLFLNSGAVEYATGTRDLQKMGGLAARMPVTASTNFVAALSIAGVPPLNGFWSKLIIIVAAIQAERYGYAFWAALASVLTLASFMKVMKYAYWGGLGDAWRDVREVPGFMKASMVVLAVVCVLGGVLLLPGLREVFLGAGVEALHQGTHYAAGVLSEVK